MGVNVLLVNENFWQINVGKVSHSENLENRLKILCDTRGIKVGKPLLIHGEFRETDNYGDTLKTCLAPDLLDLPWEEAELTYHESAVVRMALAMAGQKARIIVYWS